MMTNKTPLSSTIPLSAHREPFSVMIKPVGDACNLACGYCYYRNKQFYEEANGKRMSSALLEQFIRQYFVAHPGPMVSFVWHGGEPTLAGLDFYREAVALQKSNLPHGWQCWNNIQTNGTLLDDAWCSFLAENQFDVGLSIDGTAILHNQQRKDHAGTGSYEKAVRGCKLLQKHGIQPDLLCTVTSATATQPLAVYEALKALGTGWMQFIPIVRFQADGTLTADSVSGEAYGDFLCTIFDAWYPHDASTVGVQLFMETMMVLAGHSASLCTLSTSCGHALVVEHDGAVYACDHFVFPEYCLGNITESSLADLAYATQIQKFGQQKSHLSKQCLNCPYLSICNGGCIKDRQRTGNEEIATSILCEGYRKFFAHTEKRLSLLASRFMKR